MNLLLADDDESIAMVARLGLRRAGCTVTIVDDGAKALAAGARGVVYKPFDPMTVGDRVKAIIEAR